MTQRYMDVAGCAAYIGRSVHAVRKMVQQRRIPAIKVHGRVQFDKDRLDRWMERHGRRALDQP